MPKLLQISLSVTNRSVGGIANQIGQAAIAQGWESYITYTHQTELAKTDSHLIKVSSKLDFYFHALLTRFFDLHGLGSYFSTKKLIREITKLKPDIILLHNVHGYFLNYKVLFEFLNKSEIPVVWTFHDFWPITGHCSHFIAVPCYRWKNNCFKCPLKQEYPSSYFLDNSSFNYKQKRNLFTSLNNLTIVPVSEWVGGMIRESFLQDKNIVVIPNGIDISIFKPTEGLNIPDVEGNDFIILGVASQWKGAGKGLEDYLCLSKMLTSDEKIILVGVTSDIRKGLPNNIIGIGKTSNQNELAKLYSRANVVVSLSSAETFGLTIVEGYACGTPAVVYDNTAPPLLITPETGLVARNKDVEDVYKSIQTVKKRGKAYYKNACIELAHTKFDKDRCFNSYLNLFNKLINEK